MGGTLLATDLDGTLLGSPEALAAFTERLAANRRRLRLAYVTGRTRTSVAALVAEGALPVPDYLLASVGTSLHEALAPYPDPHWRQAIRPGWSAARVRAVAAMLPALTPQPASHQDAFKCSYRLARGREADALAHLKTALHAHRVAARLVVSSGRDVDLVPRRAGKGNAVRYLAARLGIPLERVLTCGDSGNDRDMLELGCQAAIVGNALPEIARLPLVGVYRCRASHAAGVLEALERLGWVD